MTRRFIHPLRRIAMLPLVALALSGCNTLTRLSEIGEEPKLSAITNPTEKSGYRPVTMPMPDPDTPRPMANSLWRPGARAFFKDQRAAKVGDILTVSVAITDSASLSNSTSQNRGGDGDSMGISSLLGLENSINKVLPNSVDPTTMVSGVTSSRDHTGTGAIARNETIRISVAAVVVQVLPNGNLVIAGNQEVRVNYELRQLQVSGVIRREDIGSTNTIASSDIAELRVAYGGRGTISDVQTPRYGSQLLDVILPF
ncbi:flagellar basal body L-ring protein FlgH [Oleispirillum naphthae]|uniref:flagellar basal body L-ring protein FlgH n=1 Tax=Oleispirillum naphthae TaxID=2838853 RepID=UPI00308267BD